MYTYTHTHTYNFGNKWLGLKKHPYPVLTKCTVWNSQHYGEVKQLHHKGLALISSHKPSFSLSANQLLLQKRWARGWFRCGSKGSEWVFCSRGGVSDWHYDYQQKEQMENRPRGEVRIGRLELFMGPLIILFPLCMLPELCYRFLSTAEHRGISVCTPHTHTIKYNHSTF